MRPSEHVPRWVREGHDGTCRTAISEHLLECDNDRGEALYHFRVLTQCQYERLMRILEALFIKRDTPALRRQKTHVICGPLSAVVTPDRLV